MTLLNVRLNEDDSKIANRLRAQGVVLSQLVRASLRTEYEKRKPKRRPTDMLALLKHIHAMYPAPPDTPQRNYDVANRHEARKAILESLNRKRSKK
jgi:hypothetical protein